jgi:hypothetical protein
MLNQSAIKLQHLLLSLFIIAQNLYIAFLFLFIVFEFIFVSISIVFRIHQPHYLSSSSLFKCFKEVFFQLVEKLSYNLFDFTKV